MKTATQTLGFPEMDELYSANHIASVVDRLAQEISLDLSNANPILVGVLNGSVPFLADLMRKLQFPLEIAYLAISSYHGNKSTGQVTMLRDLESTVSDRHVVLVEDIVDTGTTATYLVDHLSKQNPASLKFCSLISKQRQRKTEVHLDYVGFELLEGYVVGYGLDFQHQYRNMPSISVLKDGGI